MTAKKRVWLTIGLCVLAIIEILFLTHYVDMIIKLLPLDKYYFTLDINEAVRFGEYGIESYNFNKYLIMLIRSLFLLFVYFSIIISFTKSNQIKYPIKFAYEEYKTKKLEQKKKKLEEKLKDLNK